MNIKIAPWIEIMRTSFWFVPSLMILTSLVLAAGTIYVDILATAHKEILPSIVYQIDISAARSLLGTIAASMITVTSIAFSITIVTLTLASSQFGPRLMRNFMMDVGTQFVLGMFISTFLFCIFVFCAISFEEPYPFKPGFTLIMAIVMACFSVMVLIYFIHHVAKSIQADVVIDDVYGELECNIVQLFPTESLKDISQEISSDSLDKRLEEYLHKKDVLSSESGYLQLIDNTQLLDLATGLNMTVRLFFSPGDFIVKNTPIATVYSNKESPADIAPQVEQHILLGACRTPVQDPEFAIHQLVEIALRALSSGINDPYTAITCIDKLSSVLCSLTSKTFPSWLHVDSSGSIRLVCKELTFSAIADAAFDQIRRQAETNIAVTLKLLDSLHSLLSQVNCSEQSNFVRKQTSMIEQQQAKRAMSDDEKKAISISIESIYKRLDN